MPPKQQAVKRSEQKNEDVTTESKPEHKLKLEAKVAKLETKVEPKHELKVETKVESKHETKAEPKPEPKAAKTVLTLPAVPLAPSQVKPVKTILKKKNQMKKNKKPKTKRVHNVKPTNLDDTGIGIGPARVKAVLINVSLNPDEFAARNAILAAENKPKMPKPVKDANGKLQPVEMPPQGEQVPIDKLDAETVKKIKEAEDAHELSLRTSYERTVLDSYKKLNRMEAYTDKRKAYKTEHVFDVMAFNKSFDKHFYQGLANYKTEHDSYIIGKEFVVKNGKHREPYNEWTKAAALVNKLTYRLSGNTRNIIACFIDRLVEQLAANALHNSILEKRRILQLQHAIYTTPGYSERMPLASFVETLHNYKTIIQWLNECLEIKDQNKIRKSLEEEPLVKPVYPIAEYMYDFSGYVGEVCRSVRMACAEASPPAEKERYLSANVSAELKRFCSDLINETILRIGNSLKLTVDRENVKTISDSMVYYTLEQLHMLTGCNYATTHSVMSKHMDKFNKWKSDRKLERVNKKSAQAAVETDAVDVDDDSDDDGEADAEVDAEVEEEVEVEVDD